jgi:hypothetical protein
MIAWDEAFQVSRSSKQSANSGRGSLTLTLARIVDDDDNELSTEGATGDILVRSPHLVSASLSRLSHLDINGCARCGDTYETRRRPRKHSLPKAGCVLATSAI